MADVVPSLHATDMVGSQYFPLFTWDEETAERPDGITDAGLAHFRDFYPREELSKEDIFYYVYGVLHSPDYRERYADNLGKELPRIPRVSKAEDFWAFSKAGRRLGELHVGFDHVPEYGKALIELPNKPNFRVEKMKFGKGATAKEKDKTVIQYNEGITIHAKTGGYNGGHQRNRKGDHGEVRGRRNGHRYVFEKGSGFGSPAEGMDRPLWRGGIHGGRRSLHATWGKEFHGLCAGVEPTGRCAGE